MTRSEHGKAGRDLGSALMEAMEALVSDFDYIDLASSLVTSAIELVDASAAGVMISDVTGTLQVIAASDEEMRTLELFEIQADQGPCLDSWRAGSVIISPDLTIESRWPRFRAHALPGGYFAAIAAPLRLREVTFGVLNLLWGAPREIDERDEQAVCALADLASIGLASRAVPAESTFLAEQIQFTVNARVTIEQAKGMLAEQGTMDMNAAYGLIRDYSHTTGMHLLAVAKRVVDQDIDVGQMHMVIGRS